MRILNLTARDVKRLHAVEITPQGHVVIVGGRNAQGKSSVLDAIAMALGGQELICPEPVRRGASRAEVCVDLGEVVVKRTFKADGGGVLTVETRDGARHKSPQGWLNERIGAISFDPLAFARMAPADQGETLRRLVGLNFSELERQRESTFDLRTEVNREGRSLRAQLEALPAAHPHVPAVEIAAQEVVAELEAAQAVNAANDAKRRRLDEAKRDVEGGEAAVGGIRARIDETKRELERLTARLVLQESELERAENEVDNARRQWKVARDVANAAVDEDLGPIKAKLQGVETMNREVRENQQRARLEQAVESKRAESAGLTEKIEAINQAKQAAIAAARFPVQGLSFSAEGGVTFQGLPFEQASSAEQLRVSVAIGMALNPRLKVLLIRDGSLLDPESLELISQAAADADYQLWIETVSSDGASVVIEDGRVVSAEPVAAEGGAS